MADQNQQGKAIVAAVKAADPKFGVVSCSRPNNSTVSERFGRKSIATIACSVPINVIGAVVDVTIWGRLESKADGTKVTFEAGVPKGMKFPDAADYERFLAHVEASAVAWIGYEGATDAAVAKLLGNEPKSDTARPRLVKAVKVQTAAA